MKKTIESLDKTKCTGCAACFASCNGAISMKQNKDGFLYPQINQEKCIYCENCYNICPVINKTILKLDIPKCFAAKSNKEIREHSSSGGIFTILAKYVLNHDGYVCGACFDDNWKVNHEIISNIDELDKLKRSKYVQSNISEVYSKISDLIKQNKLILFVGCPCQVAGLKKYIGKNENLITVDLVCHGVPSPLIFNQYLNEEYKDVHNIKDINFRPKKYGYTSSFYEITTNDGIIHNGTIETDPYELGFHKSIFLRKSCEECNFSEIPRCGDITLGDFWGISQYDATINDGIGVSLVLVNNGKGEQILESIKNNLDYCTEVPIDYALKNNRFSKKIDFHPNRDLFFEEIFKGKNLKDSIYNAYFGHYDVAIYGMWYGENYGSVATYYALNKLISDLKLSVLMIDKPIVVKSDAELKTTHSRKFAMKNYHISRRYEIKDLKMLNDQADIFIVGSDQVWNYGVNKGLGKSYYFDFVEEDKKRISCASSFGHDTDFTPPNEKVKIKSLLSQFDYISVRECDAIDICKKNYDLDVVQILDPVFLIDKCEYLDLFKTSKIVRKNYILAYILDPTPEKRELLLHLKNKLKIDLIIILDGKSQLFNKNKELMGIDTVVSDVDVCSWIEYIANCDYVITDSCHGVSFALIFEKQFIAVANEKRGLSRFFSLSNTFPISNNIIWDENEIILSKIPEFNIDYSKIKLILKKEKQHSLSWIRNAIFSPKKIIKNCAYDIDIKSNRK